MVSEKGYRHGELNGCLMYIHSHNGRHGVCISRLYTLWAGNHDETNRSAATAFELEEISVLSGVFAFCGVIARARISPTHSVITSLAVCNWGHSPRFVQDPDHDAVLSFSSVYKENLFFIACNKMPYISIFCVHKYQTSYIEIANNKFIADVAKF